MNNSQRRVKIRIETGKPKRKSGVWVKNLSWGVHSASPYKDGGRIFDLYVVQRMQLEEGPTLFDGLEFKLIPV